ncbi:unnamed protein product [Oppiella nova]|uniref:Methyltransferase type 11 domain-containing protein n=1 Tax=Oppiella nova TaxID=334625 RepID=A0A7R9LJ12_9ACAR|nr:unnamed protein product [Oppiella nova]CAG2164095.1 unnamed protein product [Oppiella nova]
MEFNDTEYINSLFIFKDRATKLLNKIVTDTPDKKYDTIVDIGCGTGVVTQMLAHRLMVDHIYGIDIDSGVIEFAKHTHNESNIQYINQDISAEWYELAPGLRALEGRVSLVFSSACFQWIDNKRNAMKNIYRLLKNGGKICADIMQIPDLFEGFPDMYEKFTGNIQNIPTKVQQMNVWSDLFQEFNLKIISQEFILENHTIPEKAFIDHFMPMLICLWAKYWIDYSKVRDEVQHLIYERS